MKTFYSSNNNYAKILGNLETYSYIALADNASFLKNYDLTEITIQ